MQHHAPRRAGDLHSLSFADLPERERPLDRLRMKVAQQHPNGQLSALLGQGGSFHALDHDFVLVAIDDRHDVDLHAVQLGNTGLFQSVAQVLVAVADKYHSLGRSLRK